MREGGDVGEGGKVWGVLTCLMAVTVMTKNKGRPLVTGLVGVSTITWWEGEAHDMLGQSLLTKEPPSLLTDRSGGALTIR